MLIKFKPTTPGLRGTVLVSKRHLTQKYKTEKNAKQEIYRLKSAY